MNQSKSARGLDAGKLRSAWPEARIPWDSSLAIPRRIKTRTQQPRAVRALELAVNIRQSGFHIYVSGPASLGRTYLVRDFLTPLAAKSQTPPDLVYINNFRERGRPVLLKLPAGQGKSLKHGLAATLAEIRADLFKRLEGNFFLSKRRLLVEQFQDSRSSVIRKMDSLANSKGFNLDLDEQGGLSLHPMSSGRKMSDEEYDGLDQQERAKIRRSGEDLIKSLFGLSRQLSRREKEYKDQERELEKELISKVLNAILTPFSQKSLAAIKRAGCAEEHIAKLSNYFDELRMDILDNMDLFMPREHSQPGFEFGPEHDFVRYDLNLFVDNSKLKGAPLILEDFPTFANLLGTIEREAEMGTLVTDFTLIKAGSLHRANGGYLILHVEDIMHQPTAWEGLLRILRSGKAKVEESPDGQELSRSKGIEPEVLDLNLKVVLIGPEEVYEALFSHDPRFGKLFKIRAALAPEIERNAQNIRDWLHNLALIIESSDLLPFNRQALARLVDFGTLLCGDQQKVSLEFPLIREVMVEASTLATLEGKSMVEAQHVEQTQEERDYRSSLLEEQYLDEYKRDLIKIGTIGEEIGRINGLSVSWNGDYEFGLPHQIYSSVGVGHGGIIDLEREAELSGPIHTKAMLILKSYLMEQFARDKPLVFTGSLYFEQSYTGIEGDSASGAELAALLSAIAQVPIRQHLAFTGALSQSGQILAVGGVSRKIEGFFKLCQMRGLCGEQGVIIPKDNLRHLFLNKDVIKAVERGQFHIYPVDRIEQALELLTGLPCGKRRKNGAFTPGSLYAMIDDRLHDLAWQAENACKTRRRAKRKKDPRPVPPPGIALDARRKK